MLVFGDWLLTLVPAQPCSYDNVLSIDASHWRSLLNKAVVQVRVWLRAACCVLRAACTICLCTWRVS